MLRIVKLLFSRAIKKLGEYFVSLALRMAHLQARLFEQQLPLYIPLCKFAGTVFAIVVVVDNSSQVPANAIKVHTIWFVVPSAVQNALVTFKWALYLVAIPVSKWDGIPDDKKLDIKL